MADELDEHQEESAPAEAPLLSAGGSPPSGTRRRPRRGGVGLRALLAGYDEEVGASLTHARQATSGLERVRALHNEVRPFLVVHDAVVESVLCPLLEPLPGGPAVSARLRSGCHERAELLARFDAVSRHVAAQNVYPVSGEEVEQVLDGLERSFTTHARDETARVGKLLASIAAGADAEAIGRAMALEARRVPTRRPWASFDSRTPLRTALRRWKDRVDDWSDTHWNWASPQQATSSPRRELVDALKAQAHAGPPTVGAVLEGYDAAVEAIVAELGAAVTPEAKARASYRVAAAITIHDSVVGGALCPLLEAVPGGEPAAAKLRSECVERAALQARWEALAREASPEELYGPRRDEAEALIGRLIERFSAHEREGTMAVRSVLSSLPDEAYRTAGSALDDVMWPWHSEGPAVLALRMALWGAGAPTRSHQAMLRHPASRSLRTYFRVVDGFRDRFADTWLERWFVPPLPGRPLPRLDGRRGRGTSVLRS